MVASVGFAQDAANLAPPDTTTYLQINDPAALRAEFEDDPLVRPFFDRGHRRPEADQAWQQIEAAMGLTRRQIFDRYFGRKVIFLSMGDRHEGVVVSSVTPEDAAHAIASLRLQKLGESGGLAIHQTLDGGGRVAFGGGYMVLGRAQPGLFDDVLKAVAGQGRSLADDPAFREWSEKLEGAPGGPPGGAPRTAFLFHRDGGAQEVHAAVLRRGDGRDLILDYAGTSVPGRAVLAHTASAEALDFGPLPATAIAAATFNFYSDRVDPRLAQRIDRLIAPKSLAMDIVPKLSAPWVLAITEIQGTALEEDATRARGMLPALALSVKLRDRAVAGDLDGLFIALTGAMNVVAAAKKSEPIVTRTVGEGEAAYRVADLSGPLSRHLGRPELAPLLHLTYGRVGDWYILTTREEFFQQFRKAESGAADKFQPPAHLARHSRPAVTVSVDAARVARHLHTFLSRAKPGSGGSETDHLRPLAALTRVLTHSRAATLQAWQEDDATLRANVYLQR